MWKKIGEAVLRYRLPLLLTVLLITVFMGYHATHVKMSYDFSRAIPVDNPKYLDYLDFKKQFGEDGNLLAIGIQTDELFTPKQFSLYRALQDTLKQVPGVEDVLSVATAINLVKDSSTEKLRPVPIFPESIRDQATLDSARSVFEQLPFYQGLMYNPETKAYLMGVRIQRDVLNSKRRDTVVAAIEQATLAYAASSGQEIRFSGLPYIRNNMMTRIGKEMQWFLFASVVFSAIILLLFFRSISTTLLSLAVVLIGVIWSVGSISLFGYQISILNALIPPLVVVIGIPNCIYFLNKYHTSYIHRENQHEALVDMVGKMGIVTLFCNIAAAIGFAVFALTKSAVLKEFGIVAGINIMALFFISLILIPGVLSYLPVPKHRHTRYLKNPWLAGVLRRVENWVFAHPKTIYGLTLLVLAFSVSGILRLRSEGYMVDDLPKTDKVYTDLKFFERHFKGIMPLEILVDTRRKNGLAGSRALQVYERVDSFSQYMAARPEIARPLSIAEGLKFAKQGFYEGDPANYAMPNAFDGAFVADYLRMRRDSGSGSAGLTKLMSAFVDTNRQMTRISVNMADIGSRRLPQVLDSLQEASQRFFDTSTYSVHFTGSSVTFLEGSRYIINGLKESIFWAFLLISLCMLYLFRSLRILLCSLIPNIIPLMLTAGVMGWADIALKPSTVLVFSVALGIAIDVTIRFLVNYKQELPHYKNNVRETVMHTIRQTGISIIYTSLVLIAGFIIFVFSGFGGTQALGWLTSLTLLAATVTNLVLLPVLLLSTEKSNSSQTEKNSA
jgi:predicted RND superfamily exporter protein